MIDQLPSSWSQSATCSSSRGCATSDLPGSCEPSVWACGLCPDVCRNADVQWFEAQASLSQLAKHPCQG